MSIKERMREKEEATKRIYTTEELIQFDKCLNKYKRPSALSTPEKPIELMDWETIYIKAGVKTAKGVVVQERPDGSNYIPMIEFENKVDQWGRWRAGVEFGQKKQAEDYEKTGATDEEITADQIPW